MKLNFKNLMLVLSLCFSAVNLGVTISAKGKNNRMQNIYSIFTSLFSIVALYLPSGEETEVG